MYAKIFKSMYDGSMYGAGPVIFATWIWILTHCDQDGFVEINPKMLAPMIGTDVDQIVMALDYLKAPDSDSRTPTLEGRRIEKIGPYLHQVVNYEKYRKLASLEDRRVQNREAKRRERAKNGDCQQDVSTCQQQSAMSAQVEVDTEVEVEVEERKNNIYFNLFNEARTAYPGTKRGNDTEYGNFVKKHKDWKKWLGVKDGKCLLHAVIEYQGRMRQRMRDEKEFVPAWPHFQTWINQRRFEENLE